jgi:6-phosphogluconolactonase
METLPNTERYVLPTAEIIAQKLCDVVARRIIQRLRSSDWVHLALSGGTSPKRLYSLLAERPELTPELWQRVHLWIVDERRVPRGDARLNYGMIHEVLVSRVTIPPSQVHPMPVDQADGDRHYETELRTAFGTQPARLDITLLGMGSDGHTASLFPFTSAVDVQDRWIVWNEGERVAPPRPRMTMTLPFINQSHYIALLVTGEAKRPALRALHSGKHDHRALPVAGIRPTMGGELAWFIDQAADA